MIKILSVGGSQSNVNYIDLDSLKNRGIIDSDGFVVSYNKKIRLERRQYDRYPILLLNQLGGYEDASAPLIANQSSILLGASAKVRGWITGKLHIPIPQLVSGIGAGNVSLDQNQDGIDALIEAARAFWLNLGLDERVLSDINFVIEDLESGVAAEIREGNTIAISSTGAGWGWFVDQTPYLSEEFDPVTGQALADAGSVIERLDLLTVLIMSWDTPWAWAITMSLAIS